MEETHWRKYNAKQGDLMQYEEYNAYQRNPTYLPVYDSDGDTINGSNDEVESNAGNGDELDDEEDVEHSDDEESDPERDDRETDNEVWLGPEDGEERVDGNSDEELGAVSEILEEGLTPVEHSKTATRQRMNEHLTSTRGLEASIGGMRKRIPSVSISLKVAEKWWTSPEQRNVAHAASSRRWVNSDNERGRREAQIYSALMLFYAVEL
ncbi:hypothetical protein BT96DRAFT_939224 [Gymnopus androsaceus JB14]|uniref:Uncharacterized protein n=1 Tax=Gymnopus androsaceus JB14 TaxID=1447944 RepID=A0A6A4HRL9_9AGAR|nr:hypothetical protein BT96DRAFT_939224 [Gymnopus androsaceus JB14]